MFISKRKKKKMFHEPKKGTTGQPSQWIRVCMSCERVYIFAKHSKCPKCSWPSYGAPMVYSGWLKSFWNWIFQREYRFKRKDQERRRKLWDDNSERNIIQDIKDKMRTVRQHTGKRTEVEDPFEDL